MPYREKFAWLSIFAIVITFGPYFTMAALHPPIDTLPNLHQLALYAVAAVVRLIILGIGYLALRRHSPEEARMALDERDLMIKYRSQSYAYYVLIAGMILVGGIMPFTEQGWSIVNAALFMLALAETIDYSTVVYSYRRQA